MENIDIKQQALDHYDRMIAWAERQLPKKHPYMWDMIEALKEGWGASNCSYCRSYHATLSFFLEKPCVGCPLRDGRRGCCGGLWSEMSYSFTWQEWVTKAKLVREYINQYG
jgi:hypothetical protein